MKTDLTKGIKNYNEELESCNEKVTNLFEKHPDCTPIFIAIVGSVSYGLDVENSDIDQKGVYIQDLDSILKEPRLGDPTATHYKSQLGGGKKKGSVEAEQEKDLTFYELGRYLDLLSTNNPNILELLNTPEDCIVYKHPIWDVILKELSKVDILSKKCYYTFFNYSQQQIKKATGLNKKINNPISKEKKNPLGFCYFLAAGRSTSLVEYLTKNNLEQKFCGLVNTPNSRDVYSLYYDNISHNIFSDSGEWIDKIQIKNSRSAEGLPLGYGFKGILKETEDDKLVSNELRLSPVPKKGDYPKDDIVFLGFISFNKDGYTTYCKDYKEYFDWKENRNEDRYNDNISHNQNYDGKNMSHCLRLLYMAREIAEGNGIIVRREEEQRLELLSIKKGLSTYEDIIRKNTLVADGLKDMYDKSSLPDQADKDGIENILLKIRKQFYL